MIDKLLPQKRLKKIAVDAFNVQSGTLEFSTHYEYTYTVPNAVSLSMRSNDKPYKSGALHPIFAQNLPEGYVRRYISEKLARHGYVDDMFLLALQFDNGIGHLSFSSRLQKQHVEPVSLGDILKSKREDGVFYSLLDKFYINGVTSGLQPKALVTGINDLPHSRETLLQHKYIVKTAGAEFPQLETNEYICMEAARHAGLGPSPCYLSDDSSLFVTERFDDTKHKSIGIEDFTVLLGKKNLGELPTLIRRI